VVNRLTAAETGESRRKTLLIFSNTRFLQAGILKKGFIHRLTLIQ
jgi:hypothetical protein